MLRKGFFAFLAGLDLLYKRLTQVHDFEENAHLRNTQLPIQDLAITLEEIGQYSAQIDIPTLDQKSGQCIVAEMAIKRLLNLCFIDGLTIQDKIANLLRNGWITKKGINPTQIIVRIGLKEELERFFERLT